MLAGTNKTDESWVRARRKPQRCPQVSRGCATQRWRKKRGFTCLIACNTTPACNTNLTRSVYAVRARAASPAMGKGQAGQALKQAARLPPFVATCESPVSAGMLCFQELIAQQQSCSQCLQALHRGFASRFFTSQRRNCNIAGQIKPISPMKLRFSPVASRLPLGSSEPGGDLSIF